MVPIKRRLVNPEKKIGSPRAARPHPTKANPGALLVLGTVNPERRATVTKSQKKTKPARKTKNPFPFFAKKAKVAGLQKAYKPRKIRARNPNALDMVKQPVNVAKFGLMALLGLVATRQVPQAILKDKNHGWLGYLANLVTATAGGLATGKFVGKEAGSAVMVGGGLYMMNRLLTEQLSPIGNVLKMAGVGDAAASPALPSLGRLQAAYFAHPVRRDRNGNVIIPAEITAAAAAAQPPKAGVSGMAGRNLSRGRLAA